MDAYYSRTPKKITRFFGEYRWLSNFYPSEIEIDGITYRTVEHYYQCQKTTDSNTRARIRNCVKPSDAKHIGGKINIRSDWEDIRDDVMYRGVKAKFFQHSILAQRLLDTEDAFLQETNNWNDTYWGVCKGKGENRMGKILMKVRDELKRNTNEIVL